MTLQVPTAHGGLARYAVREDTNDAALVMGIVGEDEYGLGKLPRLSGWAIDIGAHIGTVAIALAVDNPGLQVVAVEALPENAAVLREAVAGNGLAARVHVIEGAASDDDTLAVDVTYGWTRADNQPDAYMRDNRFIGGMVGANESSTTIVCPAIGLAEIRRRFGIDRVALLKIDCEGCEWYVLRSPDVQYVDLILGEFHAGRSGNGMADIHRLLDATHEVEHMSGENVGHFRAVRR